MSTAKRSGTPSHPADGLSDIAHGIRHLWHALVRDAEKGECFSGVHGQQYWVLGALSHGPIRMSELAERLETSQANATGLIDRLVERGLVDRVRDESDRRVVRVELTDVGREGMAAIHERFLARATEVLEPLTAEERAEFARLLTKVAQHKCPNHPSTKE